MEYFFTETPLRPWRCRNATSPVDKPFVMLSADTGMEDGGVTLLNGILLDRLIESGS